MSVFCFKHFLTVTIVHTVNATLFFVRKMWSIFIHLGAVDDVMVVWVRISCTYEHIAYTIEYSIFNICINLVEKNS